LVHSNPRKKKMVLVRGEGVAWDGAGTAHRA